MISFKTWLNEALSLKGNYKGTIFQRLVAAEYQLAPALEAEAIPGYRDLMRKISRQNQFLQSKFQFNPSQTDTYTSMKHLTGEIDKQKAAGIKKPVMNVYAVPPLGPEISLRKDDPELPGSSGHPLFSNDQNVALRGVHDAIAHYMGQHPFSARGEYAAYTRHLKTLCNVDQVKQNNCLAAQVLFTEIIGQTSVYYVYGGFTEQKACLLPDFDYWHVGSLSPNSELNAFFELTNKQLIPKPDFDYSLFYKKNAALAREMQRQLDRNNKLSPLPNELNSSGKPYFPQTPDLSSLKDKNFGFYN